MPRKSSTSAGAVYLDRERRIEELRAGARRGADKMPGTQRVILFGSLVAGIATSVHREPRNRVREVLRALRPCPAPSTSSS